jgi:hypothetical protein
VINCTVYSNILQKIPDRIIGTIAIANSSNEEIFWDHVNFETGVQFPLNFILDIIDETIVPDLYVFQFHIYQLPRAEYDLPLWSADAIDPLKRNSVTFFVDSDRKCL